MIAYFHLQGLRLVEPTARRGWLRSIWSSHAGLSYQFTHSWNGMPAHRQNDFRIFDLKVDRQSEGETLVRFIANQIKWNKHSILDLIDFGAVYVNGYLNQNPILVLKYRDRIRMSLPSYGTKRFYEIEPQRILYEDRWFVAYDKEEGIPCQQTPYDAYNNTFAGLKRYYKRNVNSYIALHHRLDRLTSGIMLFSRRKEANAPLNQLFKTNTIKKTYLTIIGGSPDKKEWCSSEPIVKKHGCYQIGKPGEGKPAKTAFHLLHTKKSISLVAAYPSTGRTHQIRVHLAAQGLPIVGDKKYGGNREQRVFLHAVKLSFVHPFLAQRISIKADVPEEFHKFFNCGEFKEILKRI